MIRAAARSLTGLAALLALLLAAVMPAQADPVRTGHARAELIAERAQVAPGDRFLAALYLDLDEGGWHVYWRNPGDSGLPPEVDWTLPDGSEAGEFVWPTPHAIPLTTLMNYGYEHELVLPIELTVPATLRPGDVFEVTGDATWLICLDICIPEGAVLTLSIPVGDAPSENAVSSALIAASLADRPQPFSGDVTVERTEATFRIAATAPELAAAAATAASIRFFPDGHDILHAQPQIVRYGESGVLIEVQASEYAAKGAAPLGGLIVVNDRSGGHQAWEIQAQPGAIPAGVSDRAMSTGSGGASLSLVALLAALGAAFVGGLVLNLMPCVLPVLSIKAAGLVHTAHKPAEARAHGLAYLAGVLVCFAAIAVILIGLRAAGEAAGIGFQLQYPPMVVALTLLLFVVGLNLLGVFEFGTSLMGVGGNFANKQGVSGAFFTGLLAAFVGAPCIGPFMGPAIGVLVAQPPAIVMLGFLVVGLGLAAPFVALSFSPAVAKLLPKPGAWMVTFRQVLAFPMFLTALWLLWVLAGQTGSDGVILTLLGATVLGFGIWLATKVGSGAIGRVAAGLVILAALVAPTVLSSGLQASAGSDSAGAESYEIAAEPWSPDRVNALRAEGRVVFVDFTARWCATCQVNKRVAIQSAQAKDAFDQFNAVLLIADWTNRDSVIADTLSQFGRAGVPLYLVYPASGGEPEVLPQMLSPGLVARALRQAAGDRTVKFSGEGETL